MARAQLKPAAAPPPATATKAPPAAANSSVPPAAAESSAPPARADGSGVPTITTENPWRYLHPSRIWPD